MSHNNILQESIKSEIKYRLIFKYRSSL